MPSGESRVIFEGQDGYRTECSADSNGWVPPNHGYVIEPINKIVEHGTGRDEQERIRAQQEAAEAQNQYYISLRNCINTLTAQGMQQASAETLCRRSISQ